MNYAIILAGGVGSRFWPLSRNLEPKQFLRIGSHNSMIEETVNRVSQLFPKNNIYIASNINHRSKIMNYAKKLSIPFINLLFEPERKNTFAPVGVITQEINRIDPEATILVLPCDHCVKYKARFLRALKKSIEVAKDGYIVTSGISPTRPETGYGYIKINPIPPLVRQKAKVYKVDRFIEKPDQKVVKRLIKDKRFYWNSGIFIFKAQTMLSEIKRIMPQVYKIIIKNKKLNNSNFIKLWNKLPSISIDYAVMEKTKRLVLMLADYGWQDIGCWQGLSKVIKCDKNGNIYRGRCIDIDSKNSIIWSDNHLVATLGLNNIIVVNTRDSVLVCAKDRTQDIKKLVEILKKKKLTKQL